MTGGKDVNQRKFLPSPAIKIRTGDTDHKASMESIFEANEGLMHRNSMMSQREITPNNKLREMTRKDQPLSSHHVMSDDGGNL